ncbi:MAG: beta-ketoacyl-[acyl-carrier-protein] synthase II, partial [Chloroflexota bacterium]
MRIQAEVKGYELGDRVDPKQQRYMNRSVQFGVGAALDAVADSGLRVTEENADMVGVIFGSGAGGTDMILEHERILEEKGPRRV